MCLDTVLEATQQIKESRHGIPVRINTTGLGQEDLESSIKRIADSGIDTVSLFLPSVNPKQYKEMMGHELASPCTFLTLCTEFGLNTRVVSVAGPNVNVKEVRSLAESLGAVEFEVKDYRG